VTPKRRLSTRKDLGDICCKSRGIARLAVDMDIYGYIHVWILDFGHSVDISMDIMLSHLLIKLNTYMLCLCNISLSVVLTLHFLIYLCC